VLCIDNDAGQRRLLQAGIQDFLANPRALDCDLDMNLCGGVQYLSVLSSLPRFKAVRNLWT